MSAEPGSFPYATFLNILYPQLERVDVPSLVSACVQGSLVQPDPVSGQWLGRAPGRDAGRVSLARASR
jgi:hypothetical protein